MTDVRSLWLNRSSMTLHGRQSLGTTRFPACAREFHALPGFRPERIRTERSRGETEPNRSPIPSPTPSIAPSDHPPVGRRRGFDTVVQTVSGMPIVDDFVPGFEASAQFGLGAPKNTPVEVIEKLNHEINAGLTDPKMKARLADLAGAVLLSVAYR